MPASTFPEYARHLSEAIDSVVLPGYATLVNLQVDQRSALRGFVSGLLVFADESQLHVREFVDLSRPLPRIMYAYHYQDVVGNLIFRYDNAVHQPPLPFVEHKHGVDGITRASPPLLTEVLDEIVALLTAAS